MEVMEEGVTWENLGTLKMRCAAAFEYAAMVLSQKVGVQPRASCSCPDRRGPVLGLGVALRPL